MNLTQLATLKARLGITDTTDDVLLASLILTAGAMFERYTNRKFERTEGATFEFRADSWEIVVDRYPIEIVIAFDLKSDENRSWQPVSASVLYVIRDACVISMQSVLGSADEQGRVMFNGGYVLPGATAESYQFALPDDLEEACLMQCQFWYQHRRQMGLSSAGGPAGSVSFEPKSVVTPLAFLPTVELILQGYRRITL